MKLDSLISSSLNCCQAIIITTYDLNVMAKAIYVFNCLITLDSCPPHLLLSDKASWLSLISTLLYGASVGVVKVIAKLHFLNQSVVELVSPLQIKMGVLHLENLCVAACF